MDSPDSFSKKLGSIEDLQLPLHQIGRQPEGRDHVRHDNDITIADKRQEVIHEKLPGFEVVRWNPPGILICSQVVDI